MQTSSSALTKAIFQIMRPLVKLLLKQGIAFDALSDQLKILYVDVAEKDFAIDGKKQTISRISTITGLSRKEVKKAKSAGQINLDSISQQYNRAARVISGWIRDEDFLDKNSKPKEINLEHDNISFTSLVKRYSGDVPPRAIADELIRVGAIKKTNKGKIKLVKHAYVPEKNIDEKLNILGTDVSFLIKTISHNIYTEDKNKLFQRKVSYDAITKNSLDKIKANIQKKAQKCLEDLDKTLVKYDTDMNKDIDNYGRCKIGVGIYYFEEINDDI